MEQFNKFIEFIRKYVGNQNKKKLIENSLVILIIGIIVIIAAGSVFGGRDEKKDDDKMKNEQSLESAVKVDDTSGKDELEDKLKSILSQIDGADRVDVMVTYVCGKETIPAFDTRESESDTKERDREGGTRDIFQKEYESSIVYSQQQNGAKEPVVIKDIEPVVKGVVVVCEGGGEPDVKENIIRAVQALTDIAIHKIQVFEKGK